MYLLTAYDGEARSAVQAMTASSLNAPAEIDVWHRRFGHAGIMSIRNLATKALVDGLNVKGDMEAKGLCEDCIYGKHTAHPYDAEVEVKTEPNQCVHIDLWGPASVVSLGGASYMMLAVDRGTSRMTAFFLSRKDATTTLEAFKGYHTASEKQTGRKL